MIKEKVKELFSRIPSYVEVVVAAKKRSPQDIKEAIEAGIEIIGENYVQEAERKKVALAFLDKKISWHLIGHLQKNKVKKAVKIFDLIQTLDSTELAELIDRECKKLNKVMPVMIEINIASEPQKSGVLPEDIVKFIDKFLKEDFKYIKLTGLMTMGPFLKDREKLRPYFRKTKEIFEEIKNKYKELEELKYLSMGMSDDFHIALEEGSNMLRLGRIIFDEDYPLPHSE